MEEAADGPAALHRLHHDPPDIIVLDLSPPTISGLIVHEHIAAHAHTRDVPVVIVTRSDRNREHLNVPCVLRTPGDPEKLALTVRQCLKSVPGTTS